MTQDDVVTRFCALASRVGAAHGHRYASDCFCGRGIDPRTAFFGAQEFQFEEPVMEFIEAAVSRAIKEHRERQ